MNSCSWSRQHTVTVRFFSFISICGASVSRPQYIQTYHSKHLAKPYDNHLATSYDWTVTPTVTIQFWRAVKVYFAVMYTCRDQTIFISESESKRRGYVVCLKMLKYSAYLREGFKSSTPLLWGAVSHLRKSLKSNTFLDLRITLCILGSCNVSPTTPRTGKGWDYRGIWPCNLVPIVGNLTSI